jgi:hypothetical protein
VGERTLVTQEDLANGALLLQQLDQIDFRVTAAFWAYDPVLETWRLIIAAPQQAIESLVAAYGTIQRVINDNYLGISLDRISLISDGDAKLVNLRALAESDSDDVVEASGGRAEIAGRVLDDIHLYRGSALRYEREVFQALQRLQPPNVVIRTNVILPPGQEIDALLDDGEHPIIVEIKMRSRPVGITDVFELQGRLFSCSRLFGREAAAILVSRSGFTSKALEAAENTRVTLAKWAGREDDEQIERALASARRE